jgi:aminoglycoside phosphotransferase (APT) family kinase protein
MTTLPATLDQDATRAVLAAALQDVHGANARLEAWTADTGFTQHGKRRVVRYDLRASVAGVRRGYQCRWVGKFYDRDEDARRVAIVLQALATSDCGARGTLVPGVVAYHAPRRLLLLTYEPGEPVSSAIAHDTEQVLAGVGRALAALHTAPVAPATTTTPAAVLDDLRPRIAELCARLPGDAGALRDGLIELERTIPAAPGPQTFVHGDFGPANVLWRMGRIVVLDFDKCARGDPAVDLGNLLAQLRRMTVRKPDKLRDYAAARASVLASYRRWSPPDPALESRVAWYERATLLRKIHRLALDPNWHEAETRRLLCDSVRSS